MLLESSNVPWKENNQGQDKRQHYCQKVHFVTKIVEQIEIVDFFPFFINPSEE